MPVVVDTNILLRTLQPASSQCAMAQRAINTLRSRRETMGLRSKHRGILGGGDPPRAGQRPWVFY